MKQNESYAQVALKLFHGYNSDQELNLTGTKEFLEYENREMDQGKIGFDLYDAYRLVKFNHFDSASFENKV